MIKMNTINFLIFALSISFTSSIMPEDEALITMGETFVNENINEFTSAASRKKSVKQYIGKLLDNVIKAQDMNPTLEAEISDVIYELNEIRKLIETSVFNGDFKILIIQKLDNSVEKCKNSFIHYYYIWKYSFNWVGSRYNSIRDDNLRENIDNIYNSLNEGTKDIKLIFDSVDLGLIHFKETLEEIQEEAEDSHGFLFIHPRSLGNNNLDVRSDLLDIIDDLILDLQGIKFVKHTDELVIKINEILDQEESNSLFDKMIDCLVQVAFVCDNLSDTFLTNMSN